MLNYKDLDSPALVIDREIMMDNIKWIQAYANNYGVGLRPHTKTHKMPYLAQLQVEAGARGISVAKIGEAEVMAAAGLDDIFIANQIVGRTKLERIRALARKINISFGADCREHIEAIERVFAGEEKKAQVLIEIEVGENRSGVIGEKDFIDLVTYIKSCDNVDLKGIFSHEGFTYGARDIEELREGFIGSQERTLRFAKLAEDLGSRLQVVSIGATPPTIHELPILDGITEIRPGTYILMDMGQANALGSLDRSAARILASVISKPTGERVVLDIGAKAITMQTREGGLCATKGLGYLRDYDVYIDRVYDEHGIINKREFRDRVEIGDKVEVIPNHICPVVNLYDIAYLVVGDKVIREVEISARGRLT